MSGRLIDLLLRLAPRERMLLGALFVLVLPLALVLGVLWPLAEARQAAKAELTEAIALDDWVLARKADLAGLARPATQQAGTTPISAGALEQSLIDNRLRTSLSSLETRAGGQIALEFDAVPFTDLMSWLDAQDPGWGYDIAMLRLARTERPSLIAAQLTLIPVNSP